MKPEKITAEMLLEKPAERCEAAAKQVDTFRSEWPDGAEITMENLNRAVELDLDIVWFGRNFCSAIALEALKEVEIPAKEACEKAVGTAREAFRKAIAPDLYKAWQRMK